MFEAVRRRYLDLLASIYIYNEYRGYTSLDRVLEAVRSRYPRELDFIAEIEKHRADERKHYVMFRRYFELRGYMPYRVDRTCGHIDRLIRFAFGCGIDDLDTQEVISRDDLFQKLCRVIMLTEIRGMHTVDTLLHSFLVREDRALIKIFQVIERDEPSHWMPYMGWLRRNGGKMPTISEKIADSCVHLSIVCAKLPLLFFNPRLRRRTGWQDETDTVVARPAVAAA
jgi:hypothetical protein